MSVAEPACSRAVARLTFLTDGLICGMMRCRLRSCDRHPPLILPHLAPIRPGIASPVVARIRPMRRRERALWASEGHWLSVCDALDGERALLAAFWPRAEVGMPAGEGARDVGDGDDGGRRHRSNKADGLGEPMAANDGALRASPSQAQLSSPSLPPNVFLSARPVPAPRILHLSPLHEPPRPPRLLPRRRPSSPSLLPLLPFVPLFHPA